MPDLDDVSESPWLGCVPVGFEELLVIIGIVVAVAFLVLFVVPLLIAVVELALLAMLVLVGALVRVLLRRPWIVDAIRMGTTQRHSWKAVGWRASGELVESVAGQIATGQEPRTQV